MDDVPDRPVLTRDRSDPSDLPGSKRLGEPRGTVHEQSSVRELPENAGTPADVFVDGQQTFWFHYPVKSPSRRAS